MLVAKGDVETCSAVARLLRRLRSLGRTRQGCSADVPKLNGQFPHGARSSGGGPRQAFGEETRAPARSGEDHSQASWCTPQVCGFWQPSTSAVCSCIVHRASCIVHRASCVDFTADVLSADLISWVSQARLTLDKARLDAQERLTLVLLESSIYCKMADVALREVLRVFLGSGYDRCRFEGGVSHLAAVERERGRGVWTCDARPGSRPHVVREQAARSASTIAQAMPYLSINMEDMRAAHRLVCIRAISVWPEQKDFPCLRRGWDLGRLVLILHSIARRGIDTARASGTKRRWPCVEMTARSLRFSLWTYALDAFSSLGPGGKEENKRNTIHRGKVLQR
ncbi:hypothetical protein WOLCODRAFT_156020 [Wolfiporia cocos MD-104 SS10]|uniref:Uncharacterized protein n=1 Tax=Wolfiporia cocos (strain MD-104) TaxID=742152 RepID=A0A2H3J0U9_WOLCO|nr:hypothetical protein WOLCODRAFT_156020 [Wolfiporia cocos MD-104 SS10]